MKENEAPEKVYIHEASAPELTEKLPYHIEYIRKDAFIKEVCEWIKKNVYSYTWYDFQQYEIGVETDKLTKDLKKYFVNE